MTTVTTSNGTYIFVEVPKYAKDYFIEEYPDNTCSLFYSINEVPNWSDIIQGNYTFLCTTETITEDIAKGIVYKHMLNCGYEDYDYYWNIYPTALESFNSLLQSQNLSLNKTYAICKQN
jgi:hypothetical protein